VKTLKETVLFVSKTEKKPQFVTVQKVLMISKNQLVQFVTKNVNPVNSPPINVPNVLMD